jgi:hypothetical protein
MEINKKYKSGFIEKIDSSIRGDTVFLENPLERVDEGFNLMQQRYTTLLGTTGSGKTSMADYLYVLGAWEQVQNRPDIHYEVLYFSLERSVDYKYARWISWFIYRDYNHIISTDKLLGYDKSGPLNSDEYAVVRSYDDEMTRLLQHVKVYDGKTTLDKITSIIRRRADELGTLYYSDEIGVFKGENPVYIERFSDKNLRRTTELGEEVYIELEHEGQKFEMVQDDRRYFLKNKKTFLFIIIDGIGLIGSMDFNEKKSILDKTSTVLADARDIFGFSPVVVVQMNRSISDTNRAKMHGSDLAPRLEDIQGSSQIAHDSDLVLGLFDPYTHKAYDAEGYYGGYNIIDGMLHPKGFSRHRSLHFLKNTFGFTNVSYSLGFIGESNHFETLPFPDDELAIQEIYANIASGKL